MELLGRYLWIGESRGRVVDHASFGGEWERRNDMVPGTMDCPSRHHESLSLGNLDCSNTDSYTHSNEYPHAGSDEHPNSRTEQHSDTGADEHSYLATDRDANS